MSSPVNSTSNSTLPLGIMGFRQTLKNSVRDGTIRGDNVYDPKEMRAAIQSLKTEFTLAGDDLIHFAIAHYVLVHSTSVKNFTSSAAFFIFQDASSQPVKVDLATFLQIMAESITGITASSISLKRVALYAPVRDQLLPALQDLIGDNSDMMHVYIKNYTSVVGSDSAKRILPDASRLATEALSLSGLEEIA